MAKKKKSVPEMNQTQSVENLAQVVKELVKLVGSSNFRVTHAKVKVDGVWYVVEVARP